MTASLTARTAPVRTFTVTRLDALAVPTTVSLVAYTTPVLGCAASVRRPAVAVGAVPNGWKESPDAGSTTSSVPGDASATSTLDSTDTV